MSLAGEFGSFLEEDVTNDATATASGGMAMAASAPPAELEEVGVDSDDVASIPALALAVFPPLLAGIYFSGGEEFVQAISISGSYASPLLYGVIPILLAWNQRKGSSGSSSKSSVGSSSGSDGTTTTSPVDVSAIFRSVLPNGSSNGERNEDDEQQGSSQELAPFGSFGLGSLGLA